jgi:hypothetical protein
LLAPVYGWFTEGFDTKDLLDAKALLAELGYRSIPLCSANPTHPVGTWITTAPHIKQSGIASRLLPPRDPIAVENDADEQRQPARSSTQ